MQETKPKLKLYGGFFCPFTQRSKFILEQANFPFEYVEINLETKENQTEWYKSINPFAKVPALIIDEKYLIPESSVINEYLSETILPDAMPTDPLEKAMIRKWMAYASENLNFFFPILTKIKEGKIEEAESQIKNLQEKWSFFVENSKLKQGSVFLFGDKLSLLDFSIIPFLYSQSVVLTHFSKKKFLENNENQKISENLTLLNAYLQRVKEQTSWKHVVLNLRQMPQIEKIPTLTELGMTTLEKFDYDQLILHIYEKRA